MPRRKLKRPAGPTRGLLHLLNRRYHAEWQRAELLANELAGMRRSKLWRIVAWLRRFMPVRMPPVPHLTERAAPYRPVPRAALTARVSIVIPFRDQPELLRNCLRSLKATSYRNSEIVLIDNGSTDPRTLRLLSRLAGRPRYRVVTAPGPFNFSRLCNLGAARADSDHLLFLNNDTEVISRQWLEEMLHIASDPRVGIVGATLLYPDRTIQHVGLFPRSDGLWVHPHRGDSVDESGEHGELHAPRTVPAVTAACLLIRRSVFEELHGFDERFPVAYNDVDLCLRVRRRNLLVTITPKARLLHYEGLTRGCTIDVPPDVPH